MTAYPADVAWMSGTEPHIHVSEHTWLEASNAAPTWATRASAVEAAAAIV
jgi:hypothetical protein